MSKQKCDGMTWAVFVLFALAGFFTRLRLDDTFDRIVETEGLGYGGMLDSLMLEASHDLIQEEGEKDE